MFTGCMLDLGQPIQSCCGYPYRAAVVMLPIRQGEITPPPFGSKKTAHNETRYFTALSCLHVTVAHNISCWMEIACYQFLLIVLSTNAASHKYWYQGSNSVYCLSRNREAQGYHKCGFRVRIYVTGKQIKGPIKFLEITKIWSERKLAKIVSKLYKKRKELQVLYCDNKLGLDIATVYKLRM
jgi:hypothetical protein